MPSAMQAKVLDSFALIAYFRDESGAEAVEEMLVSASKRDSPLHMTDVNYAEVKYSIVKKTAPQPGRKRQRSWRACPLIFIPQPARWPTLPPISRRVSS